MNNTNAINELVNFLTANPETPKMVAQGIIESIYACNPSEMDKVAPYFAYLLEFAHKLGAVN